LKKFSVVTETNTKTASNKNITVCPKCGEEILLDDQNVPVCPEHGTEPFEEKDSVTEG
jgi:predicted RNA-binding Zn-ribbon protein involved in translation (DUF1610 family)